jgi:hypothetical protein
MTPIITSLGALDPPALLHNCVTLHYFQPRWPRGILLTLVLAVTHRDVASAIRDIV